jgi:hypothetical protein
MRDITNLKRRVSHAACVLLLLAWPAGLAAQSTSGVTGRVLDAQGAVVPGATVILRNQESGRFRETLSGANGSYNITGVDPGLYQLEVTLTGFQGFQRSNLRLVVGSTEVVDVALAIGGVEQTVVVTTETPLVDLASSEIGGDVTQEELINIPTTNRDFSDFLDVLPGVVAGDFLGQDQAMFTIDGGSNNDMTRGGAQARVPIEAIQEFELIANQADASQSTGGALIRVVTKSGTNQFHGSGLFLANDSSLRATDYFVKIDGGDKPDEQELQYVASLGGPIIRNRAHFFASYEQFEINESEIIRVPGRPDLNRTIANPGTVYNSLVRFDHQISTNHSWSLKWLREYFPELGGGGGAAGAAEIAAIQTAEDKDQAFVAEYTSVLSPNAVNTVRFGVTFEDYLDSSEAFKGNGRRQALLLPTMDYEDFRLQQAWKAEGVGEHTYLASNTLSWYIPRGTGGHDIQTGVEFGTTRLREDNQSYANGMFSFSHNLAFDPSNPATYPDRFRMRLPGAAVFHDNMNYGAAYVQDKWRIDRLTLNLGVRYEVEVVEVPEPVDINPKFSSSDDYPVDLNNFAPRVGFAYRLDDQGRTAIRGGYGKYYLRTEFGWTSQYYKDGPFAESFLVDFPLDGIDPGPSTGRFPTHPALAMFPVVNQAWIAENFPPGTRQANVGDVFLDDPGRHNPYTWQGSFGMSQQLTDTTAVNVDYVYKRTHDLIVLQNLNPPLRTGTSRRDRLLRPNPQFEGDVWSPVNIGKNQYDGLIVEFTKRYSQNYSFRASYTLGFSRGNIAANDAENPWQLGDDLRMDLNQGPLGNDRRHNLAVSGVFRVPYTGGLQVSGIARFTTGSPFSIVNSNNDPDRNGVFQELAPAGTYTVSTPDGPFDVEFDGSQNGGRWPNTYRIDARFGYNFLFGAGKNLNIYLDFLNLDDHVEWDTPSFDQRQGSFLIVDDVDNDPRAMVIGARFQF